MKYSLRSLFVAITLVAAALGCWTHRRYCLNCADLHEQQSSQLRLKAFSAGMHTGTPPTAEEEREEKALIEEYWRESKDQERRAAECRKAIWRPWLRLTLDSPPEPAP